MKKLMIIAIGIILLYGCSSYKPPKVYTYPKSQTYSKTYDEVWSKIIQWFGKHNTPIKNLDKNSGFISTEYSLGVNIFSKYCDCGEPGSLMIFEKAIGNFNVVLIKINENQVKVDVNTFFKGEFSVYNFLTKRYEPQIIDCNSTGVLERELFDFIGN